MPSSNELDRVFAALAHPVRRAILEQCGNGHQSIQQLAKPHSMSLNAISKHVKMLESAQLVRRTVDGNVHHIAVDPNTLQLPLAWLDHHARLWDQSLNSLKAKLESSN